MSTDRATGGDHLMCQQEQAEEGPSKMHADDAHFDMVDKLRHDDFKGMVKNANDAHNQQEEQRSQLCLGADGTFTRADPTTAYTHLGAQRREAQAAADAKARQEVPNEDDELKAIRAARLAAMQQERAWRDAGHGKLRELRNEMDFIEVVRPRERAVILMSDNVHDKETPEIQEALVEIAKKHVEAQFCYLEMSNAGIMAEIVNLEEGLPVIFITKYGQVTLALSPPALFEYSSASSPMFPKHLTVLLRKVGGIGSGIKDANSDSEADAEEEEERRRRKRF